MSAIADPHRRRRWPLLAGAIAGGVVLVAVVGTVVAITGADLGCVGAGTAALTAPAPSASAREEIPASRLALYRAAGRRFSLDWAFLAAIGAQECGLGSCAGDNGSGCAGPMQIAIRRRSPCSPGDGPTLWERYRVDGDRDGRADVDDPADAIFTAARILRRAKGAPATGGSYEDYHRAACAYYGACADPAAAYADEVMARAVRYGFRGRGTPPGPAAAVPVPLETSGSCASGQGDVAGGGFGEVVRAGDPRRLAPLPGWTTGGRAIDCDERIVEDVQALVRRYRVRVSACYAIHSHGGEHPLGAATDLVPDAGSWRQTTERLARDAGWKPACAASGVAPACARPPFRFIAYNGYPGHGDPGHCHPCGSGPHLHLSWQTSASPGQPENAARDHYFAPSWIDVFAVGGGDG